MSALRSTGEVSLFAHHAAMGVYGMVAGWLVTAQPLLPSLCTTRPLADRLLWTVSMHIREHLAMFLGMALANATSVAIVLWAQRSLKGWRLEAGRGTRCFVLMSIGMLLGCTTIGDAAVALPGAAGSSALLVAMLAGALVACMADRLCPDGISMVRFAAYSTARPAQGAHAR
ncbi:MAG: hypothetical protein K0Q76_2683 [Panacagrimonas sp.]|jgi:hypothetical protein|nr:hypothetical protein [Panacagrimonas sp.]MCC2657575.1 hypothetical protein [Panacagrimonas sp.]